MKAVARLAESQGIIERYKYPLFGMALIEPPQTPKDFTLSIVDIHTAVRLNELWHSRLPLFGGTSRICFALEFNDVYFASAIWSQPVARLLPQQTWMELRRLAISDDAPYNTASWMLAKMAKRIKDDFPEIERLVSYQDLDVHSGTIYKASNWQSTRHTIGGDWIRPNRFRRVSQTSSPKIRWEFPLV